MPHRVIFRSVRKAFMENVVLDGFDWAFSQGCPTMLTGPSGCGKTTVLRLAAGLTMPDEGSVEGTKDLTIGYVFQEDRLVAHMDAQTNVALVCANPSQAREVPALLNRLGLENARGKHVSSFSGGMKRRVAIARALITRPQMLLFDEPFTGLDDDAKRLAASVIKEYLPDAVAIFVTHDAPEGEMAGFSRALRLLGGKVSYASSSMENSSLPMCQK